eukprot:gene7296-14883_t
MSSKLKLKRPASANPRTRAPPAARNNSRRSRSPTGRSRPNEAHLVDLATLDREELINSIESLKREQNANETSIAQLRAENQRMENEVSKQQRRIDKLLLPMPNKNGPGLLEMRKDIEKSGLVRQLKAQVHTLRSEISHKEAEIEELKRSQKSSHLMELIAEKDEYFSEVQRLRQVVHECNEKLAREKKQRDWDRSVFRNNEADLKKELTKLALGYQELLERLANSDGAATGTGPLPDSFSATAERSARAHVKGILRGGNPNAATGSNISPRSERQGQGQGQGQGHGVVSPNEAWGAAAAPQSVSNKGSCKFNQTDSILSGNGDGHGFVHAEYQVGDHGEALYKDRTKWFPCIIRSVNTDGSYNVAYDDGDFEVNVPSSRFRYPGGNTTTTTASHSKSPKTGERSGNPLTSPLSTQQGKLTDSDPSSVQERGTNRGMEDDSCPQGFGKTENSDRNSRDNSISHLDERSDERRDPLVYDIGDKGEGNYKGDGEWFECTVVAVNGDKTYQLEYGDGEVEKNVNGLNFRLTKRAEPSRTMGGDVNTGNGNEETEAKLVVGSKVEVLYNGETKYYPGVIARKRLNGTFDIDYDDGEKETGVDKDLIKALGPSPGELDRHHKVAVVPSSKYKLNDKGEGNYRRNDKWYPCTVTLVNSDGTYRLNYDDGEVEDHVPDECFLPKKSEPIEEEANEQHQHLPPLQSLEEFHHVQLPSKTPPAPIDAGLDDYFANLSSSGDSVEGFPKTGMNGDDKVSQEGNDATHSNPPASNAADDGGNQSGDEQGAAGGVEDKHHDDEDYSADFEENYS